MTITHFVIIAVSLHLISILMSSCYIPKSLQKVYKVEAIGMNIPKTQITISPMILSKLNSQHGCLRS